MRHSPLLRASASAWVSSRLIVRMSRTASTSPVMHFLLISGRATIGGFSEYVLHTTGYHRARYGQTDQHHSRQHTC